METAQKHFSEKDAEKLVGLLNFIGTNAKFKELDVKQVIEFYRILNWAQTELLPKVQANIFEIQEVKQMKKAPK